MDNPTPNKPKEQQPTIVQPTIVKPLENNPTVVKPQNLNEQQKEEVKAATKPPVVSKQSNIGAPSVKPPPSQTTAEVKQQTTKAVEEESKNFTEAVQHLSKVKEQVLKFAGKQGYNPHMWIKTHIEPLEQQINSGVKSQRLADAILVLKADTEPKV